MKHIPVNAAHERSDSRKYELQCHRSSVSLCDELLESLVNAINQSIDDIHMVAIVL